ncbi:hypothetical protein AAY473_040754 [Plecturocebus cupreus]
MGRALFSFLRRQNLSNAAVEAPVFTPQLPDEEHQEVRIKVNTQHSPLVSQFNLQTWGFTHKSRTYSQRLDILQPWRRLQLLVQMRFRLNIKTWLKSQVHLLNVLKIHWCSLKLMPKIRLSQHQNRPPQAPTYVISVPAEMRHCRVLISAQSRGSATFLCQSPTPTMASSRPLETRSHYAAQAGLKRLAQLKNYRKCQRSIHEGITARKNQIITELTIEPEIPQTK